ncbi:MAG: hypothetical protein H6Q69_4509 [Firmicutes bacterium]|nr:hypothetical protein [Bacillota bacterium]
MGLAISFKLIELNGTIAKYGYGLNFDNFEGIFEVDTSRVKGEVTAKNEKDIYFNIVIPCNGESSKFGLAGKLFVKIFRYYQEHGHYPKRGGHYAG